MTNAEVARTFSEIADLLEIQGADSFRVSSYRRVSRTVEDLSEEITQIAARGELSTLPGIGKSSAGKIQELLETGRIALRDQLAAEVPPTLLELLRIPHMGPKKVALLWKERGVTTLSELVAAIEQNRLAGLKGFGDKTVAQIREGIEFMQRSVGRARIGTAWAVMETVRAAVAALPGVKRIEPAGSLRRGRETIGDIDLLCVAAAPAETIGAFARLPGVTKVLAAGDTKGSVLVDAGGEAIQVDLRVVPEDSFGAAWQYFTGSKEHNVRLRELAGKRGWTLNEYALTEIDTGRVLASRQEQDIYAALGLPWIPPELREDRGELEGTSVPKDLLELADIRGELHLHTTASDGRETIEQMAAAARARGYKYICITDHSQSSVIANGLKPERLRAHVRAVRAAAARLKGITLWVGAEVDIHSDGRLDYDDDLLAELDFVVASVHFGMGRDAEANTRRTLAAIRNPYVNLIAHPTGRLINKRDAMPIDIDAIARAAAETGTALEINASDFRLDLRDQHARRARELGAVISINCDAHAGDQFDNMRFGVMTARRAGLRRGDVLNTRSAREIEAFVARKRNRKTAE
ncbi:MAG: DNA polymerase/3'-5' exonuclease PolX [Phycisphaerae bacterium]|jgi:DNA polymerase (family 10)